MFGAITYIIWLALFVALPLLVLLIAARHALWERRRALAFTLAGALAGGWAWDALIVRLGVWYYDPRFILNWWIAGLPLEEWLWIAGVTLLFGGLTILLEERKRTDPERLSGKPF